MRQTVLLLCFGAGLLATAHAQLDVSVTLDQSEFLSGEPIFVAVRVANRSGEPLRLGATADWLKLSVLGDRGVPVDEIGEVPVTGAFDLESATAVTKLINVEPWFKLAQPGSYKVVATVRVAAWDKAFGSAPASFNVSKGVVIWNQEFGVPRPGAAPEMRKYSLQQTRYQREMRLYVRVTDQSDTQVFRVFGLGMITSFGQPEAQVDKWSRLHVLFQSGARSFIYCVINPDGRLLGRLMYDYTNTRPKLAVNGKSEWNVVGGVRHPTAADLPWPPDETATNAPAPLK